MRPRAGRRTERTGVARPVRVGRRGPRAEAAAGEFPLRLRDLLHDLVVVRQAQASPVFEPFGQSETCGGGSGQHDQGVEVLPGRVQTRRAELRLGKNPFHQPGKGLGRTVQHQAADAVQRAVAIQHAERPVRELRAGSHGRGTARGLLYGGASPCGRRGRGADRTGLVGAGAGAGSKVVSGALGTRGTDAVSGGSEAAAGAGSGALAG